MKYKIKQIPFINSMLRKLYRNWITLPYVFNNSKKYWIKRYQFGGSSGMGSYNKLAEFKAEIVNAFITEQNVKNVIEFGCGDGNQLKLYRIPSYTGFDISPEAIALCRDMFENDQSKSFKLMSEFIDESAEMTMSLDVIYHLIEDHVFRQYMNRLFDSAEKYVIIYSSDKETNSITDGAHVKHRKFTGWINVRKPEWTLIRHIPNRYPFRGNIKNGSLSDFFIYERKG